MRSRLARWLTMVLTGVALAALASGCARKAEVKGSVLAARSNHVSPPPVAVPRLPPGSFDRARAHQELLAAAAARLTSDAASARASAEAAVAHWPADLGAWDELAADCRLAKDEICQRYAAFFRAKVEFVATLPPRAAVLGFASLAAGSVGTRSGDYVYDAQTLDTALRLASFYDEQDELRDARFAPRASKDLPKPKP